MADLPSILGGMAQGFIDFGKGAVDLFGTGGAAIGDLVESARTGKVTTKNQDDFRKWLYNTDSVQDAAAKGLGTALNGVQTVSDYLPGINVLTRSPLGNAAQGALGGLADEFKTYGEDYDLGRAGQRAAVSGAAAAASGSLADALKGSSNALLSSNTLQGLARGATGGAITGGGYAAIDGGDVLEAAKQGAGMGALLGGATGAMQDFRPSRTYEMPFTEQEKQARIANIDDQLSKLDTSTPEGNARYNELMQARNRYDQTFYHGSPETDITEFDINRAGRNTQSGEKAIYFTDSPEVADEFSYRRLPSDSMFIDNKGEKGRVYQANLDMQNTLDLDNLTDAQIRELWQYASPLGQLDGQDKFIQNMTDYRDKYHNAQAIKSLLDMQKLSDSPYDSFSARMYPNQDNMAKEYGVFSGDQVKLLEDALSADDMAVNAAKLTPETAAVIAGKPRTWDELYGMLSNDAGAYENESRAPITATAKQLQDEIQAIDAQYPDDMPDDVWSKRFDFNQQLKALESGYDTPYDYYVGESKRRFREDFESRPDRYKSKIADLEKQMQAQASLEQDIANASPRKLAQFEIIQKKNPAPNDTLTWIRSPKDIMTWDETITAKQAGEDVGFSWPDYSFEDALRDQKRGKMTVYSSYPVKGGTFVTPSYQQASDYAGGGRVYSKVIKPEDVAWINGDEGQYAYTKVKSLESTLADADMAVNDVMASKAVNDSDGGISVFTNDMDPKTRRALDIITNQDVPTENELYNRIDPETLPQGYEKLRNLIDNKVSIDEQVEKKLGKNPLKADVDELLDYLYPNEPLEKKVFHKSLNESIEKYKRDAAALGVDASKAAEDMTRTKKLELVKKIYDRVKFDTVADIGKGIDVGDDLLYATQAYNHRGIRTGYPGALDTALSERLEIAPGNTIKITDSQYDWTDDDFKRKNLGRYTRNAKDISVREGISGIEGDISTMAHERLHSFQNEARPENVGRYSKEVTDAYDELSKDLKPYIKDSDSVAKIYGASDTDYYASPIEQESRMLQTYLDNKGYTKDALFWRNKQNGGKPEWGNEINPAFDKFFDKLRDLSKRGVALPALAALFGGGAYMASQNNDKEKEVK